MDSVMGVAAEYYAKTDDFVLKSAKSIIENSAKILRKKNSALIITTSIIEGSPKGIIFFKLNNLSKK